MPDTAPTVGDATPPLAMPALSPDAPAPALPEARPAPPAALSPAACAARLAELFPALFSLRTAPKPLKLRIQADIQQRAPGIFTRKVLSIFLHRYTTNTAYLVAITKAPQRFGLDGAPGGDLTDEHRQAATAELERRRALHEGRRAAENEARRAAELLAQRERAADDQARRDRAALLRAFETSTLTRANFCALKRIAEGQLDAQLAQARQEAAERAAQPLRDEHRANQRMDHRNDRQDDPRNDRGPARPGDGRRPPRRDRGPRPPAGPNNTSR